MIKYSVYDVCDYILYVQPMSTIRLQRMLYFCYSFYLSSNNDNCEVKNRLFANEFEAWIHGPTVRCVFDKYTKYAMTEMSLDVLENDVIEEKDKDFIKKVIKDLENYSTYQLGIIAQNQFPWRKARENYDPDEICKEKLDDSIIFQCFIELV